MGFGVQQHLHVVSYNVNRAFLLALSPYASGWQVFEALGRSTTSVDFVHLAGLVVPIDAADHDAHGSRRAVVVVEKPAPVDASHLGEEGPQIFRRSDDLPGDVKLASNSRRDALGI